MKQNKKNTFFALGVLPILAMYMAFSGISFQEEVPDSTYPPTSASGPTTDTGYGGTNDKTDTAPGAPPVQEVISAPETDSVVQPVIRTCQDDGYPVGFHWDSVSQACIGVTETVEVALQPAAIVAPTVVEQPVAQEEAPIVLEITSSPTTPDRPLGYDSNTNALYTTYSPVSIALTALCIVLTFIALLQPSRKEEIDGDNHGMQFHLIYTRNVLCKYLTAGCGIAATLYMLCTENFTGKLSYMDSSTPILIVLALTTVSFFFLSSQWHGEDEISNKKGY